MAYSCIELFARYEAVGQLSQQILAAAKRGEWDQLIELEQARAPILDEIEQVDTIAWPVEHVLKKEELIRAILAADEECKPLIESRMVQIRETLGSLGVEKKLRKAYE
jgi:flagellar protein FliT